MSAHDITAALGESELSPELINALEALEKLDDDKLWRLASEVVPRETSQELEALHLKMRDERLSPEEDAARARLMQEYERSMLIRAQAAMLLKERGHDISRLLVYPSPTQGVALG